jgi:hypothetical protein
MTKPFTYEEMLEIGEKREMENSYFNFYVADYLATGEGRTIWIVIDCDCDKVKSSEDAVYFMGSDNQLIKQYTEEDFLKYYNSFLPGTVRNMIDKKNVSRMNFKQKFKFNYS